MTIFRTPSGASRTRRCKRWPLKALAPTRGLVRVLPEQRGRQQEQQLCCTGGSRAYTNKHRLVDVVNEQQTLHEPKGMERGRRASRASFRIRSAMERSHPLGSESADRLVVVDWQRAKRGFDFARIDDEISVRRGTLKEWPVIPRRAHMHVVVCDGRQHSTFRVVLDQARCLNLPRGSMGRGLKLVSSNCDAALPFCVVALCRTKERLTEAFDRSPGGEEGYGMLRAKSTFRAVATRALSFMLVTSSFCCAT